MKILKTKFNDIILNKNSNKTSLFNLKSSETITPPSNKEWNNVIYNFNNKKNINLPVYDNILLKLIKGYFNMYEKNLDKKLRFRNIKKKHRKLLGNKVWTSKTEIKHSNDKIIINLFIFSRKLNFLLRKLRKLSIRKISKKLIKNKVIFENLYEKFNNRKKEFSNINNKFLLFRYNNVFINIYKTILKRVLKKELRFILYKQYIKQYLLRYKNTYILPLKNLINRIYKKEVVFNIISLKNYYLNSDILTDIVGTKTKKRNNRIIKVLRNTMKNIETSTFDKSLIEREKKILDIKNNLRIKNNKELLLIDNNLDILIKNIYENHNNEDIDLKLLESLKNRIVTGIRLKASGRLTRRFTAQRSVSKLRYKGTIKNIDSSYKGLSSKIVKNNIGSNVQYTKINSKNRIGAFGIKGWISSM